MQTAYQPNPEELAAARAMTVLAPQLIVLYGQDEVTRDLRTAWAVLAADQAQRKADRQLTFRAVPLDAA